MMPSLVQPHKVHGTHIIIYNKIIIGAFQKSAKTLNNLN